MSNGPLLEELKRLQKEMGMDDRRFAAEINVSRALWNQVRRGTVPIGPKIIDGAYRRFPELGPHILTHHSKGESLTRWKPAGSGESAQPISR